jgi:microcystin degradation protein MlrC
MLRRHPGRHEKPSGWKATSTGHVTNAFGPIARKVIYTYSNDSLNRADHIVPYRKIRRRIRPLDTQTSLGLVRPNANRT